MAWFFRRVLHVKFRDNLRASQLTPSIVRQVTREREFQPSSASARATVAAIPALREAPGLCGQPTPPGKGEMPVALARSLLSAEPPGRVRAWSPAA
jgi:hypothetical protein